MEDPDWSARQFAYTARMRYLRPAALVAALALLYIARTSAVTPLPSADGQFWDVQDTSPWAQDSGGIATGGRAQSIQRLRLPEAAVGPRRDRHVYLRGFGLAHDGDRVRLDHAGAARRVLVARAIFAPKDTTYLRYFDSFTNTGDGAARDARGLGRRHGAYDDGGRVAVAVTSSGDRRIDPSDAFVTVMQNARGVADPSQGPVRPRPVRARARDQAGVFTAAGDMYADPFTDAYPGFDPAHMGYVFTLTLAPGETKALVTFVVKGLSEVYDPRGGYPDPARGRAALHVVGPGVRRPRTRTSPAAARRSRA